MHKLLQSIYMNVWTSMKGTKRTHFQSTTEIKNKHNLLAQSSWEIGRGKLTPAPFRTPILPTFSPVYTASKTIPFHEPKARALSGCRLSGNHTKQHLNPLWLPTSELHVTHCLPNILCSSIKEWSGIWKCETNFSTLRTLMYIQLLTVLVVV